MILPFVPPAPEITMWELYQVEESLRELQTLTVRSEDGRMWSYVGEAVMCISALTPADLLTCVVMAQHNRR